jgi:hypothetical protein
MAALYTKNGEPLRVSGDRMFNRSGKNFGRIKGSKVYGQNGRYIGTIVGSRLVYRSTDSARVSSPFAGHAGTPTAAARAAGSALWGDEPDIS